MDDRDLKLAGTRPKRSAARNPQNIRPVEAFQNRTLRPVIRLQQDLLVEVFGDYTDTHKKVFQGLSVEKRLEYIDHVLQRDMKFRNSIRGMIVGMFTLEEYRYYFLNASELNRRIITLVSECLKEHIQLFSTP